MEVKNKQKLNSVIKIDTTFDNFFEHWLQFIKPLHRLSDKDITIAAAFLKKRFELEQVTSDQNMIDEFTFSPANRKEIKEKYNLSTTNFQVILTHLRKLGFLKNGKIEPKFIPKRLSADSNSYQLLVYFNLNNKENEEIGSQ